MSPTASSSAIPVWNPKWAPAARQALLNSGYEPIPLVGKRPVLDQWQNSRPTSENVAAWEQTHPTATDTGVLTRLVPAVDIDVLAEEVADIIHGWVTELIPPSCPELLRIGRFPKRAILFRCDAPFPKISTGKWIDKEGVEHQVEILCDGQQLAVYGEHPDTHQPYTWPGARPGRTPRACLPVLTAETAQSLVNRAKTLFHEHGWRPKRTEHPKTPPRASSFERSDSEAHKIALGLADRIEALCRELLPAGAIQGKDWAIGDIDGHPGQSLRICLVGEHRGLWLDHADEGWRGDALDLVEAAKNLKPVDAMDWARSWLGWPPRRASPEKPKPTNAPVSNNLQAGRDWSDPDWSILDDRRGDLPDFPTGVFAEPVEQWLERAARGAGVHSDHVAIPLLAVASSLIGTARRVCASRSWTEPMTLWTALIAASGDRKTPGINVSVRALSLIEKDSEASIRAARLVHETRAQAAKEATKKWKDDRQAALDANPPREPPPMPLNAIDPGNFIEPRLYATDPTIERLAALLQVRPRGMLLIRDELSGLFANMGRYSGGSDRPFWLESWNGGRHVVERVSGAVVIPYLLVGVTGGFQPDKLTRAFAGDEDGMYGRFLYGWPATPDYQPLTNEVSEVEPEIQNALNALIRLPAEAADDAFATQVISLSEGAIRRFEEYRRAVDNMKRALDGRERQWLVKSESQVLRLAGTLAYLAWGFSLGQPSSNGIHGICMNLEPDTIDEVFMINAIRLVMDYLWPHARAAMRQIGLTDRHANARRALLWIRAHKRTQVSLKDIRREALNQSLDAEQTQELLSALVKAGWARETTTPTAGRSIRRWEVNPKLFSEGTAGSAGSAESVRAEVL